MKKIVFGLISLVVVVGIYYFTTGSQQIRTQMKTQLNQELVLLQKEGFTVFNRSVKEKEEHFVISFDEPEKIAHFFSSKGIKLHTKDATLLKGLHLGVDVHYLPDTYSAVSFDLYPLALPSVFATQQVELEKMLAKKTFLIHIAVNKFGTAFKGHMKDVDEVLHTDKDLKLNIQGLNFSADIKNKKLHSIKQKLDAFTFLVPKELTVSLKNVHSTFTMTGKTPYELSTDYNIDEVTFDAGSTLKLQANDISLTSNASVKDGLSQNNIHAQVKTLHIVEKAKTSDFEGLSLKLSSKNLDIKALNQLQNIDVNKQQEVDSLLQKLLVKGMGVSIPTFSITHIRNDGLKMEGFEASAKIDLSKSIDVIALRANPLSALSSIDANINIKLSKELFNIIAQHPKAMIALMLFQPKDVNGKKSYDVVLKNAKLLVNGMPVF
jgi:hypothetical protein